MLQELASLLHFLPRIPSDSPAKSKILRNDFPVYIPTLDLVSSSSLRALYTQIS
jgi:hypothetical protein